MYCHMQHSCVNPSCLPRRRLRYIREANLMVSRESWQYYSCHGLQRSKHFFVALALPMPCAAKSWVCCNNAVVTTTTTAKCYCAKVCLLLYVIENNGGFWVLENPTSSLVPSLTFHGSHGMDVWLRVLWNLPSPVPSVRSARLRYMHTVGLPSFWSSSARPQFARGLECSMDLRPNRYGFGATMPLSNVFEGLFAFAHLHDVHCMQDSINL